jgi:hypothetical protein
MYGTYRNHMSREIGNNAAIISCFDPARASSASSSPQRPTSKLVYARPNYHPPHPPTHTNYLIRQVVRYGSNSPSFFFRLVPRSSRRVAPLGIDDLQDARQQVRAHHVAQYPVGEYLSRPEWNVLFERRRGRPELNDERLPGAVCCLSTLVPRLVVGLRISLYAL